MGDETKQPKFKVGDAVWHATHEQREKWIVCPDCMGQRWVQVTFGDGTAVTVDCQNCGIGYEPPLGSVKTWEWEPRASLVLVEGLDVHQSWQDEGEKLIVRYSLSNHRGGDETCVFDNEEEAKAHAQVLAARLSAEEEKRINGKERTNRTWSWNASYHRKAIKQAQRDLEYHTRKLEAAKQHVKAEAVRP